jgi:hypothetical protein
VRLSVIVAGLLAAAAGSHATSPAPGSFEARIVSAAGELGTATELKTLSPEQQRDATIFVVGNMLYSVVHEMGHAVLSEMQLPVLGRQEDAADSFAIVAGIKMMTNVSERALIEAGKGWFFNELSERKRGAITVFYDSHGMNLQRAYQIVCFMVGANPERFKPIADATNLPEIRRTTCKDDYAIAAWSWEELLKPFHRTPDKPVTTFDIGYDDAEGELSVYAKTFKDLQFLERIATMATDAYVWRRPLAMKMETCGKVNAWWNERNGKITVCYELVAEFAQLYMQFMGDPAMEKRMQALKPVALSR